MIFSSSYFSQIRILDSVTLTQIRIPAEKDFSILPLDYYSTDSFTGITTS